jgi:N-acetylneuraminic acid mutarotase
LPEGVHHPGVAALGGRVYVVGGYDADHGATAALWAYDPAADAWERRSDMATARGALGLVAFGDRLYAVGGATEHLSGPVTGAVEVYDPQTDQWSSATQMPTPREHLAVAAGADRIFAVGGRANNDEGDAFAGAAEAYDPVGDRWEALPPLPTPRGGCAGAFAGGRLIVLGGERGPDSYDAVEAYDPVGQTWSALPPLPLPRHGLAAVGIGDKVYAIAGSTRAGAAEQTDATDALTLATA